MSQRKSGLHLLVCLALAGPTSSGFAQGASSPELLAAEASGLALAARAVRDPRDRGRLAFLAALRIERIRTEFPTSAVATELAFGRYGEVDASAIDRDAKAFQAQNGAEAEALRRGELPVVAAAGQGGAAPGLLPNFGRAAAPSPGRQDTPDGLTSGGGRVLPNAQLTQLLRDSAVFIYVPSRRTSGSGFFISPTHILTNTHVVDKADRVVVANKTIGVRAARILYLGKVGNVGPDTAVIEIENASSRSYLGFAAATQEGDRLAMAGYPGSASQLDRSYGNFIQLISQNRLPTTDNIPNVKFDFGYLQSLFVKRDDGIENAQVGISVAAGNSGSPVVNLCGEVIGQAYAGTNTIMEVTSNGNRAFATGESIAFSFAIALKELTKFLATTSVSFTTSRTPCTP